MEAGVHKRQPLLSCIYIGKILRKVMQNLCKISPVYRARLLAYRGILFLDMLALIPYGGGGGKFKGV